MAVDTEAERWSSRYSIAGPLGSVDVLPLLILNTDQRSRQHPDPETLGPAGPNARPIIALYDQTQDAVGGGGSNSSPSQPLVTSRLHRKQAADSNARTTPSIVRSRGSNFRNPIIKSAYQIRDALCNEQTKVATVATVDVRDPLAVDTEAERWSSRYSIVGPFGSVIMLPVLILIHGPTFASTPPAITRG